MDERLRFVARLLEGEKMAPLCAEFGISRKTGYKIFERYKDCGVQAFSEFESTTSVFPPPPLFLRDQSDGRSVRLQPDHPATDHSIGRRRTQVHGALRRVHGLVSGQFLNRSGGRSAHCQMGTKRVSQDMHPRFHVGAARTRRTITCTSFCVSGCPFESHSTRLLRRCRP
jgi:Homeodomain-like domain-containing protein